MYHLEFSYSPHVPPGSRKKTSIPAIITRTKVTGYNRQRYLTESLLDLDQQLRDVGSQLFVCEGNPVDIFSTLHKEIGLTHLSFEQDCEAIWNKRDNAVRKLCSELGVTVIERISHTLWDPFEVIEANGDQPPTTYEMFVQVIKVLGDPPKPSPNPDWENVLFGNISDEVAQKIKLFPHVPSVEEQGYTRIGECPVYIGGEKVALAHLQERLIVEENAFRDGYILPNQVNPDLLGPPMSMSAALRFGCLSVRKFYWDMQETYQKINRGEPPASHSLTAQLIWREFFYCMSANNPKEGWIHHVCRTVVSCFLTRGDLWISWVDGLKVFYKYLIDADWSVAAGNWMWISSSAFERQLDCSVCVCPVEYGRRIEPTGDYIRQYVPELANFPQEFIFEPWKASLAIQKEHNCIIGQDYPERIVNHTEASKSNSKIMKSIRKRLKKPPRHCSPSDSEEIKQYLRLPQSCFHNFSNLLG
ncbi:Cryptochrome-1 [Portunus trituberculatus]|uniref:Cryptochrome-1 n=1 Tax=Portunus trituberculatus TaxID=210409 RepID=A0A5B7DEJ9_PORTR|nr:Cryptochrome-1 [Portunus trituberculatus]